MNRIIGAARATYNFFAGDAILLGAVAVAFVLATLLERMTHAANALIAISFVAVLVAGLVVTLGRELRGRPRQR